MTLPDTPVRFELLYGVMAAPTTARQADGVVWADGAVTVHYALDSQPSHRYFRDVRSAYNHLCASAGESHAAFYFVFHDHWDTDSDIIPSDIAVRPSTVGRPHHARFQLQRTVDATGVSGTGHVADGIRWSDGTASLRWRPTVRSHGLYDSMEDVETIHGHDGQTKVKYLDKILIDFYGQGQGRK